MIRDDYAKVVLPMLPLRVMSIPADLAIYSVAGASDVAASLSMQAGQCMQAWHYC